MKKCVLASLLLMVSLSVAHAQGAKQMENAGEWDWEYTVSGGEATITGIHRETTPTVTLSNLIIPSVLGGYPVRYIGARFAKDNKNVGFHSNASLVIPDSVIGIGESAFSGIYFSSVTFGQNLQEIGEYAFESSCRMQVVDIPDSVTSIDDNAFQFCTNLTYLTLGTGLTNIGSWAFSLCSSLTSVDIPDSMTRINEGTFVNCSKLKEVRLGRNVNFIGTSAFLMCSSLHDVYFMGPPPEVEYALATPFMMVAAGACGHYTEEFAEEWLQVIGDDGKWYGLIMAPSLRVAEADPTAGTLTLAWNDGAVKKGVTYSIYRGAGEKRADAILLDSGLTETTWTDANYWKAEPVLEPLNYWVVANGGGLGERESNRVETRHRYGVFVGLSDFAWYNIWSSRLPEPAKDAAKLRELFVKYGGIDSDNSVLLQDSKATFEGVSNAIAKKAEVVLPGDMFVLYIATHGGYKNGFARVSLYDSLPVYGKGGLLMSELFGMLNDFNPSSVVIPIIMACHSGAFVDYAGGTVTDVTSEGFKQFVNAGLAMCRANMPVMTSCGAAETSRVFHFQDYSDFGEAFFHYGWEQGYADGKVLGVEVEPDGFVSFLELIQYAKDNALGLSDALRSHVEWMEEYDLMLDRLVAGRVPDGAVRRDIPEAPATIEASQGSKDAGIEIWWDAAVEADWYRLYRLKDGRAGTTDEDWECIFYKVPQTRFFDKATELERDYRYRVRAVNGAGSSTFSSNATGHRGTPWLLEWIQNVGSQLGLVGTVSELASMPSANGTSLEACYVAGVEPTDADAAFKAKLVFEDGKWKAKPAGGEKAGRVYRVEGRKDMTDEEEEWVDVTDVEDVEEEGFRFFRVGVALAE